MPSSIALFVPATNIETAIGVRSAIRPSITKKISAVSASGVIPALW